MLALALQVSTLLVAQSAAESLLEYSPADNGGSTLPEAVQVCAFVGSGVAFYIVSACLYRSRGRSFLLTTLPTMLIGGMHVFLLLSIIF